MEISDFKVGTRIECRWVDILSEVEWKKPDDLDEAPIITTIGFFVGMRTCHTKECVILASSLGMDSEVSNTSMIPLGTIISVENLDERA